MRLKKDIIDENIKLRAMIKELEQEIEEANETLGDYIHVDDASIEDFTSFVTEIVNYGDISQKEKLLDIISDCGSIEDLPTDKLRLI